MPLSSEFKFVRARYAIALIIIAVLSLSTLLITKHSIHKQKKYGEIINMSGRQRMLSQRLALFASQCVSDTQQCPVGQIKELLELFGSSHGRLSSGTMLDGEKYELSDQIKDYYFGKESLNTKVLNYMTLLKTVQLGTKNWELDRFLSELNPTAMLKVLNGAVTLYQAESDQIAENLKRIEETIFALVLFILAMEVFFIFLPLENKLQESFDKIESQKEAAIAGRKAKANFLANITHELRTPLNGILGPLQLINRKHSDETTNEYLDVIETCAKNSLEIVNDILDFEKLESGRFELVCQWSTMDSIFEDLEALYRIQFNNKGVALNLSNEVQGYEVFYDRLRVKQILVNLLSNALKYTDKGQVDVFIRRREEHLVLGVYDTGDGIAEKYQETIFDSFSQVYQNYEKAVKGTGLGLSIVKKFSKLMNGDIKLESRLGEGARFTVTIPTDFRESDSPASLEDGLQEVGSLDLAVLVAEDNAINQMVIERLLKKLGQRPKIVSDGLQAVNEAQVFEYDCIFLDIQMPVMDGIQAYKKLREQGIKIPVFACTANGLEIDRERYLKVGFDEVVSKPISNDDLVKVLNTVQKREKRNAS